MLLVCVPRMLSQPGDQYMVWLCCTTFRPTIDMRSGRLWHTLPSNYEYFTFTILKELHSACQPLQWFVRLHSSIIGFCNRKMAREKQHTSTSWKWKPQISGIAHRKENSFGLADGSSSKFFPNWNRTNADGAELLLVALWLHPIPVKVHCFVIAWRTQSSC